MSRPTVGSGAGIRPSPRSCIASSSRVCGYAHDLDLSELEITLEDEGRLGEFTAKYNELFAKTLGCRKGQGRTRHAAGQPCNTRARARHVHDSRQLARIGQEQGRHHAQSARGALSRADEAPPPGVFSSLRDRRGRPVRRARCPEDARPPGGCPEPRPRGSRQRCGSSSPRRRS